MDVQNKKPILNSARLFSVATALCLSLAAVSCRLEEKRRLQAEDWLVAAEKGDPSAQYSLGGAYYRGSGVAQDRVEAARWYRAAAEQGNPNAQFSLGQLYDRGEGVPVDKAEAAKWYRMAAERGIVAARMNLGALYETGQGVPLDKAEASRWYRLAAEQGNSQARINMYRVDSERGSADAMFHLGYAYDTGSGVYQNKTTAIQWYEQAANRGHAPAQNNLGSLYYNRYYGGDKTLKLLIDAAKWYRTSAELGLMQAQYNLAVMLHYGQGMLENRVEAVKWYSLATEQGHTESEAALKALLEPQRRDQQRPGPGGDRRGGGSSPRPEPQAAEAKGGQVVGPSGSYVFYAR
jgi:TPR repeat protein